MLPSYATFFFHLNQELTIPFPRLMFSLLLPTVSFLWCFIPLILSLLFPFLLLTPLTGLALLFFIFLRWSAAHSRNIFIPKEKVH